MGWFVPLITAALGAASQEEQAKASKDYTVQKGRAQVKPVDKSGEMGLGNVMQMGSAFAQSSGGGGGGNISGGEGVSGGVGNMAPIQRALDSKTQAETFAKAQNALQYAPQDLQQTLGPVFRDALKRQANPYGGY